MRPFGATAKQCVWEENEKEAGGEALQMRAERMVFFIETGIGLVTNIKTFFFNVNKPVKIFAQGIVNGDEIQTRFQPPQAASFRCHKNCEECD